MKLYHITYHAGRMVNIVGQNSTSQQKNLYIQMEIKKNKLSHCLYT